MMNAATQALIDFKNRKLLRKPAEIDEHLLRKQRDRGEQASRMLNDPIFVEAFEAVEKAYLDGWRSSSMDNVELRERAWTSIQLLSDLKAAISRVAFDGAVAEETLTRFRSR